MKKALLTLLASLACSVSSANIIITEILYNPAGTDVPAADFSQEWVEIYNTGSETVDLTGWMLRDEDGNSSNWGTLSGSLAAGEVGVITTSTSEGFKGSWPSAADAVIFTVPGWGSIANGVPEAGNEVIQIQDSSGTPVDFADYLTVSPWPEGVNGQSIYLLPGFMTPAANDNGANWAVSSLGVDGAVNPVAGTDPFNTGTIGSPGTVVPEPSSYALLLGAAMIGFLINRRRR